MIFYDMARYCNLIAGKTLISQLEKDSSHALFPPSLKSESSSSKTCFYYTVRSLTMNNTFLIGVQADLLRVRVQKIKAKAFSIHLTVLPSDSFHSHSNSISQSSKLFAGCTIIKMVKAWSSYQYWFCLQIFNMNIFCHWKHSSCAAQQDK